MIPVLALLIALQSTAVDELENPGFDVSTRGGWVGSTPHTYQDWVVDPVSHVSLDGAWECRTTPLRRSGQGASLVQLSHHGRVLWEVEAPLAFPFVAVSDEGHVIACGATRYWFEAWLFAPADGKAKVVQRISPTRRPHVPDGPYVRGILVQEELGLFTLRFAGEHAGWLSYRLSDGEPVRRREPWAEIDELSDDWRLIDARRVRGTPLCVVQWVIEDRLDTRVSLIDGEDREVWSLDLPGDLQPRDGVENAGYDAYSLRWQGTLGDAGGVGVFAFGSYASQELLRFFVQETEAGGWSVEEVSRTPELVEPVRRPVDVIEPVELELLGESSFETTTDFRVQPSETVLHEPVAVVDSLGRILVADLRLPSIEIFDLDGRLLERIEQAEAFRRGHLHPPYTYSSLLSISVDDFGGVHLGDRGGGFHTYVHADCGWIEASDLGLSNTCFVPDSDFYWQWDDPDLGIRQFDGAGFVQRTITRGPGGRWLRAVHGLASNRQGALAVLEDDHSWLSPSRGVGETLLAYDERGELLRSWILSEWSSGSLARCADWIAWVRYRHVLLAHPVTGRLMQFATEGHGKLCLGLGVGFASNGTELIVAHPADNTIRRYALPRLAEDDAPPIEGR